jgi:thymidylate synthase (FAD)
MAAMTKQRRGQRMKSVKPAVYLIANTQVSEPDIKQWLDDLDDSGQSYSNYHSSASGQDSELLIELAARRCYKSFVPGLNANVTKVRDDSKDYHANILSQRHGSVLSHATCTWSLEGVSRVLTHELVRNSVGNAFSQESMRYVRLDHIPFWLPPEIESDPEAMAIFQHTLLSLEGQIRKLNNRRWRIKQPDGTVEYKTVGEMPFHLKKKYTSLFRRLAPDGIATGIVVTHNMRSLRWIIEQRTSRAAEYEIRLVYNLIAKIAVSKWPMLFQDFESVDSGDGEEVREWVPKNSKV